jgi:hypothetical protein
MQVTAMKKELAELKARLKVKKDVCKTCEQWECGYCGVSHDKRRSEHAEEVMAVIRRTLDILTEWKACIRDAENRRR